jgi:phosphoglycerol transferase
VSERVSSSSFESTGGLSFLRLGSAASLPGFRRAGDYEHGTVARSPARVHAWARRASNAAYGVLAMLMAFASAAAVLELWRGDLRIPYAYSSDALFLEAVTKNLQHGWYYTNPHLGAPFGQQLYDFPIGNALNMAVLKLLALGFSDPSTAVNVFFLATFPLTALAAFVVMRTVRVSLGSAVACSVLFALLPYHFRRGEAHAFLSAYYAIPLIAYLMLGVFGSCRLFESAGAEAPRWRRTVTRRNVLTFAVCAIVGACSPYYALAAVILLVVAGLISGVAHHSVRHALTSFALAAVILGTFVASAAPAVAYRLHHGANHVAGKRSAFETELYGLKVTDLVLPVDDHRLKPLARMKEEYDSTTPVSSEGGQTLGFIGTFGLLALLGGGFVTVARGSWRIGGAAFLHACAATVIVLLFATTAGFSSVLSYTLTPQLHAWNRLSVLVGFFSFLAVAFLLDALRRRWRASALRFVFPAILLLIVTAGVLDQTSEAFIPRYKETRRTFQSDARFFATLERRLPAGAALYQLPYVPFPESGAPGVQDYAELRGYLHSSDLRWSYGAMKGREGDWSATLSTLPLRLQLPAVAAAGFDGITLDRTVHPDNSHAIKAGLDRRLRLQPFVSPDGTLLFYDLRPLRDWLRRQYSSAELSGLRVAALHPVTLGWTDSFWDEEHNAQNTWRWSKRPDAYFVVDNPTSTSRRVTLRFVLGAGLHKDSSAIVFYPDRSTELVRVAPAGTVVERTLNVAPGRHFVRISSDAPKIPTVPGDPRTALYIRVANASLLDGAFSVIDRAGRPGIKPP